jgi:LytR cell envelope-related transcriptional attenuator
MELERWRSATIVVTLVAALEFVLLAAAGIALLGNPLSGRFKAETASAAAPSAQKTQRTRPTHPTLPRREVSVIVLNGNGRAGAAAIAAGRVRSHGYVIGSIGNATRPNGGRSVVMYRAGYEAEAARLAHDLRVRIVSPLDGMRASQLMGSHLVLLLGTAG